MHTRDFLKELRTEVERHPAVNHLFLNRIATSPFSKEDYQVFAEHHFPLVCVFTSYLERLLMRAPDSEGKLWLARVLVDEYGEGSDQKDHAALYASFFRSTGGDPDAVQSRPVPGPAHSFISTHRALVSRSPFLVGLGAIGPGHEWAIPKMFDAVIPGLRRARFSDASIRYFVLHVAQDQDHGRWLEEALARYATGSDAQAQIRKGALASLEARGRFWDGVQRAVMRYRQPRAVRPDGPEPRGLVHEILLTAWDGVPLARSVAARLGRVRNKAHPPLERLLEHWRNVG